MKLFGMNQSVNEYIKQYSSEIKLLNQRAKFGRYLSVYEAAIIKMPLLIDSLLSCSLENLLLLRDRLSDMYSELASQDAVEHERFTAVKSLQVAIQNAIDWKQCDKNINSLPSYLKDNVASWLKNDLQGVSDKDMMYRLLLTPFLYAKVNQKFCTPLFIEHEKLLICDHILEIYKNKHDGGVFKPMDFFADVDRYLEQYRPMNNVLVTMQQYVEKQVQRACSNALFSYELERYVARRANALLMRELKQINGRVALSRVQKKIMLLITEMVRYEGAICGLENDLYSLGKELKNHRPQCDSGHYLKYKRMMYRSVFDSCAAMAESRVKIVKKKTAWSRLQQNWSQMDKASVAMSTYLPPKMWRSIEIALVSTVTVVTCGLAGLVIAMYNKAHYNRFSLLKPGSYSAQKIKHFGVRSKSTFRMWKPKEESVFSQVPAHVSVKA